MIDQTLEGRLAKFREDKNIVEKAIGYLAMSGSGGPIADAYYNLIEAFEFLVHIAPFKVGDRVELVRTPNITEKTSPGWMGSKHFLVEGARATVACVDFYKTAWRVSLIFDDESWISSRGSDRDKVNPIALEDRSRFTFNAASVRKVEAP